MIRLQPLNATQEIVYFVKQMVPQTWQPHALIVDQINIYKVKPRIIPLPWVRMNPETGEVIESIRSLFVWCF